jgi:TolB protein
VATDVYGGRELAYSPDGKTIVFGQLSGDNSVLYAMTATGHNVRRLTSRLYNSWGPDFSPDGKHIIFTRAPRGGFGRLFVMNRNGSGAHALTGRVNERSPTYSPDGKQIAYVHNEDNAASNDAHELFVANADGSSPHRLTHTVSEACAPFCVDNDNPTWQPVTRDAVAPANG